MTARIRSRIFVSFLSIVLMATVGLESKGAERIEQDWCSSVVVRPDRRQQATGKCDLVWSESEVAKKAGVVLMGGYQDVSAEEDRSGLPYCGGPYTHQRNAAYIKSIRALRPKGEEPILFAHMARSDLVSASHIQAEGFRSGFLVKTKTPISKVAESLRSDQSPDCQGACRWAFRRPDHPEEGPHNFEAATRAIDSSGPGPTHEEVVYYVSLRQPAQKIKIPHAAVANLTNPDYRSWRVQRYKRALGEGGYDAVMLNEKFAQYFGGGVDYWLGSSTCLDVSRCTGKPDTIFSAKPDDYGFAEYVAGWVAFARDLKAADVPYMVRTVPHPWLTNADDPSTPEVNEALEIESVLEGARLVLLGAGNTGPTLSISDWERDLSESGVRILPVDGRCGYAKKVSS